MGQHKHPRQLPVCKKCGGRHWNYLGCDEPEAQPRQPPLRITVPRKDGLLPWRRDKLDSVQRIGQNSFVTNRLNPVNLGRILFSDEPMRLPKMPSYRSSLTYPPHEHEEE